MALHKVIGIDLGTTYSAVAAYNKDEYEPKLIKNEFGKESVPSVVSFFKIDEKRKGVLIGGDAKNAYAIYPDDTIMEIKREMGELLTEDTVKKFKTEGVYGVGKPVRINCLGEWYLPQEISALILMRMKQIAESEIGEKVNDAVITVPAYFTEKQKKATKEAALLAGLRPLRLVPEPTAAAISFGLSNFEEGKKTYLVYDLGGGTFDVSIISVEDGKISVIATSGNYRLGGADFDEQIIKWASKELKEKNGIDLEQDEVKKARVKIHAEDIKKQLSEVEEVTIKLMELNPQDPPELKLTRAKFEEMIDELLDLSLVNVEEAIKIAGEKDSSITKKTIDAILLVGGSSKIPKVKEKLLVYFGREESFVRSDLNPDTVVAKGAAILGNSLAVSSDDFDITETNIVAEANTEIDEDDIPEVRNITEHSLGIGVINPKGEEVVQKIIHQASPIPITKEKGGYTNPGPVTELFVKVYQGEGEFPYENVLIGQVKIGPMEPRPMGEHQFSVEYSLDVNGLLRAKVNHLNENTEYEGEFSQSTGVGKTDKMQERRTILVELFTNGTLPAKEEEKPEETKTEEQSQPETKPQEENKATADAPDTKESVQIVEIPADIQIHPDFNSVNRRAKKLILNGAEFEELIEAYNKFAQAVTNRAEYDDIAELCDDLEDIYHDCRSKLS